MATIEDGASQNDHTTVVDSRSEVVSLTDQTNLLPRRKVVAVFFGLSLCILVSTLDATIVATALPTISAAFNAGSVVSWVPSSYFLTSTAFQPIYGRFSDIFGRKAALCMAMGIFMIGSLAAGFSQTIIQLIVLRGLAGAGGGGIRHNIAVAQQPAKAFLVSGKYQGIIGVVVAFGFAVGPLLGGVLAEKAGWRWCFWVTLPVSVCAVVVVILILPLKAVEGNIAKKLAVVDYLGTALTLAGCTLIILPLIWVTVIGVYITMLINGFVFYSALFYLPQYFQVGLGYSAIRSGIFLLPVLVSQTLASFISGQIITWTGRYRATIYVGFGVWAVACGCLSTVTPATPQGLLVFFMLLAGTGAGGTLQTTTVAAQASVSRRDMSVVTAVRNFIRLLGGTLSLAIGATIINNSLRHYMKSIGLPLSTISAIVDDPTVLGARTAATDSTFADLGISAAVAEHILGAYVKGFRSVFILNASLNAVATVAAIALIRHTDLNRGDEDELRKRAADESTQSSEKNSIAENGAGKQDAGGDEDRSQNV
ncbi:hypothetical protein BN946_scf184985.g42 [Trametes cinnabarina]|uniref:Major facilitator superfamily (MFS) profile domain-containing protein n=1 Tax=Pycnoporus cinnabarinus TaxID=5643 RepID=A0A060SJJ6_PYCCI|nr:hypothetical protein BN946_scf184985.g42 [Trametes cinnabarina]